MTPIYLHNPSEIAFYSNSGSGFLFANKGKMFSTDLVLPFSFITFHLYAVLIIILVVWLIGSPFSVSQVGAIAPIEFPFGVDVIIIQAPSLSPGNNSGLGEFDKNTIALQQLFKGLKIIGYLSELGSFHRWNASI